MLVGLQRHLVLAISRPDPRPAHLDTTTSERDLPVLVTVAHSGPLTVPLALRAHDIIDLFLHHRAQHPEPNRDAEGQQPLLRCPNQLAERFLHALRKHGLITGRLRDRYVATHGGSSLDLCGITTNAPNRSGRGRGNRRHLKVLRAPGQPPPIGPARASVAGLGTQYDQIAVADQERRPRRRAPRDPERGSNQSEALLQPRQTEVP